MGLAICTMTLMGGKLLPMELVELKPRLMTLKPWGFRNKGYPLFLYHTQAAACYTGHAYC